MTSLFGFIAIHGMNDTRKTCAGLNHNHYGKCEGEHVNALVAILVLPWQCFNISTEHGFKTMLLSYHLGVSLGLQSV